MTPEPSAMECLQKAMAPLRKVPKLSAAVDHLDDIIAMFERAKEEVIAASDPHTMSLTMTKLQNPAKIAFDTTLTDDLKKSDSAHKKVGKALDKFFPQKPLPSEHDAMADHEGLINRAIAMHLLREGKFSVATTFIDEARDAAAHLGHQSYTNTPDTFTHDDADDMMDEDGIEHDTQAPTPPNPYSPASSAHDFSNFESEKMTTQFSEMYAILRDLRDRNLVPAIRWARVNSEELETRGSNLEFELTKLQYIWLFKGPSVNGLPDNEHNGLRGALAYARANFGRFQARHLRDINELAGAMAYGPSIPSSPYHQAFSSIDETFSEVAASFTKEFCSLLGFSAESPLYIAVTAGALALPQLVKYMTRTRMRGTEWTTQNELAFETPLPRRMMYHSIFVCPVLKGQTTESNPPMMIPCGHVLAKETLHNLTKGNRFKCPYCPAEGQFKDAKQIIL
ncbi:hypothetical protein OQA88_3568 [Cercophora sp. LCS_1]